MKNTVLQIVRAFVALLHVDSDDKDEVAKLKGQLNDALAQLQASKDKAAAEAFSDSELAEINSAANMIAATDGPTAAEVKPVAEIAPADDQKATDIPATVADAAPADVAAAAAGTPA